MKQTPREWALQQVALASNDAVLAAHKALLEATPKLFHEFVQFDERSAFIQLDHFPPIYYSDGDKLFFVRIGKNVTSNPSLAHLIVSFIQD